MAERISSDLLVDGSISTGASVKFSAELFLVIDSTHYGDTHTHINSFPEYIL